MFYCFVASAFETFKRGSNLWWEGYGLMLIAELKAIYESWNRWFIYMPPTGELWCYFCVIMSCVRGLFRLDSGLIWQVSRLGSQVFEIRGSLMWPAECLATGRMDADFSFCFYASPSWVLKLVPRCIKTRVSYLFEDVSSLSFVDRYRCPFYFW